MNNNSKELISPKVQRSEYKIAVVLWEELESWKRLNVATFVVSGVAAGAGVIGKPYKDASGTAYLPMFQEPVLVFGASGDELKRTAERARSREVQFTIFTEELFSTFNDDDNRSAIASVETDDLAPIGIAFRCEGKIADKILKGLKLLK